MDNPTTEDVMDGTGYEVSTKLAYMLAEAETCGRGLTQDVFESLVRTIWEVTGRPADAEIVTESLDRHLVSLGGLDFKVGPSRLLPGAIDVSCQLFYAGASMHHTVHLW